MSKALRKQGAEVLSEKKYPLPVNGLHSGFKLITGELLYGNDLRQPCSFLGLCRKGNPGSGAQRRRTGRLPCCKGLKKTRGESMLEEEVPCDQLPVDHGFIRIFTLTPFHNPV